MSNLKFDFSGENFVVTGASSGMGRQIAIELAESGANVLAMARRENELEKLQSLYPNKIFIAAIDVCNSTLVETVINDFVGKYGKLSGAVHAAGIVKLTSFKLYDEKEAKQIYEGASFVLFSSAGSYNAAKGMFAYASAKAAIRVAVKSIAKEISKKALRINTVSPGWVKSNMTDILEETNNTKLILDNHLLGIGAVDDVSGTVLFLLSDRAHWITGTDIIVDGGYLA